MKLSGGVCSSHTPTEGACGAKSHAAKSPGVHEPSAEMQKGVVVISFSWPTLRMV